MMKKISYSVLCLGLIYSYFIFADTILKKETNTVSKKQNRETNMILDSQKITSLENNAATTIIIGSGPAGQMAALYCARLGGKPVVIAGKNGGLLEYTGIVENIPFVPGKEGKEIISIGIQQAKSFGAVFINEQVTEIIADEYPFKVITENSVYYAFSIILAMGSTVKTLGCPGENDYWGKGVSSCAVCDAPLYKDKKVIVIGGGDSACEEALQLTHYAKEIYMLVRSDKMRASQIMQNRVKNHKKITILYNTELKKIKGNRTKITEAIIENNNDQEKTLLIDGIFVAIGQKPNTSIVKNMIELDENDYIVYQGRSQKTSLAGIFGAGEIGDSIYKQAGVAAGQGIQAAIDAFHFLLKNDIDDRFIKTYTKIWKNDSSQCSNGICTIEGTQITNKEPAKIEKIQSIKNNTIISITTKKEFKKLSEKNKKEYYLVDFSASWCGGCKILQKTLTEYIKTTNRLNVYYIDIDNTPDLVDDLGIQSIPLLLLMKEDKIIARHVGALTLKELNNWIEKYTKKI